MRLGMSGAFLPARMDDFSAEIAARIRELVLRLLHPLYRRPV